MKWALKVCGLCGMVATYTNSIVVCRTLTKTADSRSTSIVNYSTTDKGMH